MRSLDLRPTFCPICDQDFVDDIILMRLGLWFGLLNGSDEPEVDHNMLPQVQVEDVTSQVVFH